MGYASDWGHDDGGLGGDDGYDDREYHDPKGQYHDPKYRRQGDIHFNSIPGVTRASSAGRRIKTRPSDDPSVWMSRNGKIRLSDMSNNHLMSAMTVSMKMDGFSHKRTIALAAEINRRIFAALLTEDASPVYL